MVTPSTTRLNSVSMAKTPAGISITAPGLASINSSISSF